MGSKQIYLVLLLALAISGQRSGRQESGGEEETTANNIEDVQDDTSDSGNIPLTTLGEETTATETFKLVVFDETTPGAIKEDDILTETVENEENMDDIEADNDKNREEEEVIEEEDEKEEYKEISDDVIEGSAFQDLLSSTEPEDNEIQTVGDDDDSKDEQIKDQDSSTEEYSPDQLRLFLGLQPLDDLDRDPQGPGSYRLIQTLGLPTARPSVQSQNTGIRIEDNGASPRALGPRPLFSRVTRFEAPAQTQLRPQAPLQSNNLNVLSGLTNFDAEFGSGFPAGTQPLEGRPTNLLPPATLQQPLQTRARQPLPTRLTQPLQSRPGQPLLSDLSQFDAQFGGAFPRFANPQQSSFALKPLSRAVSPLQPLQGGRS